MVRCKHAPWIRVFLNQMSAKRMFRATLVLPHHKQHSSGHSLQNIRLILRINSRSRPTSTLEIFFNFFKILDIHSKNTRLPFSLKSRIPKPPITVLTVAFPD